MRLQLLKCASFAALQVVLFAAVSWFAAPPAQTVSADSAHEKRLSVFLKDELYGDWQRNPRLFEQLNHADGYNGLVLQAFHKYRQQQDDYMQALLDKDRHMRTASGRRLIVVGCSSAAFGIDSTLLKERYGLTPVNLGLHGALGGQYQLNYVCSQVRPGDVIILCFATQFTDLTYAMPDLKDRACKIMPELAQYFQPLDEVNPSAPIGWKMYSDKLALADFAERTWTLVDNCHRRWKGAPSATDSPEAADSRYAAYAVEFAAHRDQLLRGYREVMLAKSSYYRHRFNSYGDYVGHYHDMVARDITPFSPEQVALTPIRRNVIAKNIDRLNTYIARYRERGAEVYFAHFPLCEFPESYALALDEFIADKIDAPILYSSVLARTRKDQHYDSPAHLRWSGICWRMQVLTAGLDRYLRPRVPLTPAEHVAQRDLAIRNEQLSHVRLVHHNKESMRPSKN